MKTFYAKSFFILVLFTFYFSLSTLYAQVPQAINFQAIARDAGGNPMVNTNIQIRLSVIDSAVGGNTVYQELRALQTNAYGSFSFQIGVNPSFTTIGTFQSIDWTTGNKFLKIDYDPTNTFTFNLTLGTIEFVSVPYAFAAESVVFIDASGAVDGDVLVYNSLTGKFEPGQVTAGTVTWSNITGTSPNISIFNNDAGYLTSFTEADPIYTAKFDLTGAANGDLLKYNGTKFEKFTPNYLTSEVDGSTTNELQTLTISNDTLYLTNGGFVKLPAATGSTLLEPTATTLGASSVNSFDVVLNGTVNAHNLMTSVAFEWGTTSLYGNTVTATQSPATGTSDVAVSYNLTGLQSATTYHFRIKAQNAVNVVYSSDMSFTTANSAPQLTTTAISSITGTTATSGGNITYNGGAAVTARGVCWSTNPSPTLSNSYTSDGSGTGSFTSNLTGLSLGTTYYVRAYATNAVGTTYGNELSFTTAALPTVATSNYSDVKGNSAKAGGSVTSNGGSTVTAQGLCWSTSPNPTTASSITTSFTATMTGLSPNTTYYVRAYATNIAGTGYGNQISFNSGYVIGSTYAGGLVFYNDGAGHGLVCAESDQSTGAEWGCEGTAIGGTSTAINTGAANTNAIVAGCTTAGIAAKLCYDLTLNTYSDWYMPSRDELALMYLNLKTQSLGSLSNGQYWSSTENADDATTYAWSQRFSDGVIELYFMKHGSGYVRAIRAF